MLRANKWPALMGRKTCEWMLCPKNRLQQQFLFQSARNLMPRASLWFLGKGDKEMSVSHRERLVRRKPKIARDRAYGGTGQGRGKRLAEV